MHFNFNQLSEISFLLQIVPLWGCDMIGVGID